MSSRKLIAGLAAAALSAAVATAPAHAATPAPSEAPQGQGIIAILIGLQQFTPPIGSNKGSFIDAGQVYGSSAS
jgi:hypothetical protein